MKFSKTVMLLAIVLILGWAGIEVLNYQDRVKNPTRVAFILNIPDLPPSVEKIDCAASAITDVIVVCAFEVDPAEFDQLLVGWPFSGRRTSGTSVRFGAHRSVGPKFLLDVEYSIEPASFTHGGQVILASNQERSLVIAKRYEE